MYTTEITYDDYNGEKRTDKLYFNLNKVELSRLELSNNTSLSNVLNKLMEERDNKKLWDLFETLVRMSYGVKSADGKRFMKNKEVLAEFEESNAYPEFIFSLFESNKANEFVEGIISDAMREKQANNPGAIPFPATENH